MTEHDRGRSLPPGESVKDESVEDQGRGRAREPGLFDTMPAVPDASSDNDEPADAARDGPATAVGDASTPSSRRGLSPLGGEGGIAVDSFPLNRRSRSPAAVALEADERRLANRRLIAIEGPIGVGKTSLARRLAEMLDAELIAESPDDNPFLERFYREPKTYALATQLHFLVQRWRQMNPLAQAELFNQRVRVADFLVDKDPLFAELNLAADEWMLYREMYFQFSATLPRPDLVVYLQAPVNVLQERIRRRDRRYEQSIDPAYLARLVDAYTQFFHHYTTSDLVIVNAENLDWVDRPSDLAELVRFLDEPVGGRRYFNPVLGGSESGLFDSAALERRSER